MFLTGKAALVCAVNSFRIPWGSMCSWHWCLGDWCCQSWGLAWPPPLALNAGGENPHSSPYWSSCPVPMPQGGYSLLLWESCLGNSSSLPVPDPTSPPLSLLYPTRVPASSCLFGLCLRKAGQGDVVGKVPKGKGRWIVWFSCGVFLKGFIGQTICCCT